MYPLWNLIIITGGKISHCQNCLVWWGTYLPVFSCLLLANLVVEGAAETTNQRKPTVITTIQWETESLEAGSFNPTINILQLKENTNMARLRHIRHERIFHIKWVKGPCWKLQRLLRKAMDPIMEAIGLKESSVLEIHV